MWARILGLPLVLLASQASADCEFDYTYGRVVVAENLARDMAVIIECFQDEINELNAINGVLLERVAILEEIASTVPSNYLEVDGDTNGATSPFAVANFELTAKPKGRAFEMAISQEVVLDLCADVEGCLLTLGSSSPTALAVEGGSRIGPCLFLYDDESGTWEFDAACGAQWGVDGRGRLPGAENPEGEVLLNISNDCAIASSGIDVRSGAGGVAQLSRDRDLGLFLITGLAVEPDAVPDDDYFCRLTLRD